jgi:glycosyltransferase involved in cell wall biosynthesis
LIVAAIPAYNEENTIAKVVVRAMRHADRVVVVDDGSIDETALIAERIGAHVLRHGENRGYGAAIRSCFSSARDLNADILVVLDGDGQHDPDLIPELVRPIASSEADIVVASRFLGKGRIAESDIPRYRLAGLRLLNRATNALTKQKTGDTQSGFRAYSRKAIRSLEFYETSMGASSEISIRSQETGLRIVEVPASFAYKGETSTHNPLGHGLSVLSSILLIASERHPIAIFVIPGAVLAAVAVAGLSWVLERWLKLQAFALGPAIAFATMLVVGMFAAFVGIVLFAISRVSRRL